MQQVHSDYLDKCLHQIAYVSSHRVTAGVYEMKCFECPCHVTIRGTGGWREVLVGSVPATQSWV